MPMSSSASDASSAIQWSSSCLASKYKREVRQTTTLTMTGSATGDAALSRWLRSRGFDHTSAPLPISRLKPGGLEPRRGGLGDRARRWWQQDWRRFTRPLHVAVEEHNAAVVDLLLRAGALAEAKDSSGLTPLELAWHQRRGGAAQDDAVVQVLLRAASAQSAGGHWADQ